MTAPTSFGEGINRYWVHRDPIFNWRTISEEQFLTEQTAHVLDRCTACGICVEVCPLWPHSEARDTPAAEVARGIVSLLRSGEPTPAATAFVAACSEAGVTHVALRTIHSDLTPQAHIDALAEFASFASL